MNFLPDDLTPACRLFQFKHLLPDGKSMYWLYATKGTPVDVTYNAGCHDMTKSRIHDAHHMALGYSARIDPTTHKGIVLEKPEQQCMHHLFALKMAPLSPAPGMVYERYITNPYEVRYFFCRPGVDFYATKFRDPHNFTKPYRITGVYPALRPKHITLFADALGVDFAEFDILDDLDNSGIRRPFIVDVNNVAGMGMTIDKFDNPADFDTLNRFYAIQVKSL